MITRKKVLKLLAYSIVFLAIIHILALDFGWYYIYPWFDMVTHFLGGFSSLFLVSYLFFNIFLYKSYKFFIFIFFVILIGVSWEVYEYVLTNMWAGMPFKIKDTTADLFFDTFGGLVGVLFLKQKIDK